MNMRSRINSFLTKSHKDFLCSPTKGEKVMSVCLTATRPAMEDLKTYVKLCKIVNILLSIS